MMTKLKFKSDIFKSSNKSTFYEFFLIFFFNNFFHRYRNFQKKYQLNIIKKTKKVYIKISLKKKKKKSNNMVIKITKISLKMKKKTG